MGRFAPSPTGALHFGSLVSALASFLDARHYGGQWLLRIEDIDPPREEAGASAAIIQCLEAHHLYWDGDILFQSQRLPAYADTVQSLLDCGWIYPCYCTRKQLALENGPYPGTCRHVPPQNQPAALRLLSSDLAGVDFTISQHCQFTDLFIGDCQCPDTLGDFIVRRKDGLFAYQLAVVVDDAFQGVTHIIRGQDLLDCTPPQQFLFQLLKAEIPQFGHVPMALNAQGQKLSKQTGARPLDNSKILENLHAALKFLNHAPPAEAIDANPEELLAWAIKHWDRKNLKAKY